MEYASQKTQTFFFKSSIKFTLYANQKSRRILAFRVGFYIFD